MTEEYKKLVAYCGLYCGDCYAHQGQIPDLARDLRKELKHWNFKKIAKSLAKEPHLEEFRDYKDFEIVLKTITKLKCSGGCKGGDGIPGCKIRKCCHKIGLEGCWECDEFEGCEKLEFLKHNHGNAHLMNLRKIKKIGVCEFLKGGKQWYHKVPEK